MAPSSRTETIFTTCAIPSMLRMRRKNRQSDFVSEPHKTNLSASADRQGFRRAIDDTKEHARAFVQFHESDGIRDLGDIRRVERAVVNHKAMNPPYA